MPGYNSNIIKLALLAFLLRYTGNMYLFIPRFISMFSLLPTVIWEPSLNNIRLVLMN